MSEKEAPDNKPIAVKINNASGNFIGKLTVHGDAHAVVMNPGAKGNVIGEIDHTIPSVEKVPEDSDNGADDLWYEKPVGRVGIGVAIALIAWAALWSIQHYFFS